MTDLVKKVNRNNKTKRNDNFYVKWLRLPDNISNVLGRQTISVSRPSLQFESTPINRRRHQHQSMQQVRYEPVSVTLHDDEGSLTSQFIYTQVYRQLNFGPDIYGKLGLDREYKFDFKVEIMDSRDEIIDGYVLRDCFISSVDVDDLNVNDENNTSITVVLIYDTIDFWIVDDYVTLKGT